MHRMDSPPRTHGSFRCGLLLLFVVGLFLSAATPASPSWGGHERGWGELTLLEDRAHRGEPASEHAVPGAAEAFSDTPESEDRHTPRRWKADAASASPARAALWLNAPAHDPPKTLRYCTLLI